MDPKPNNTKPEVIPFSEANLGTSEKYTFKVESYLLESGAQVSVGVDVAGSGARLLQFNKPTLDGKMSELKFGITQEAAEALLSLLLRSLHPEAFSQATGITGNTTPDSKLIERHNI